MRNNYLKVNFRYFFYRCSIVFLLLFFTALPAIAYVDIGDEGEFDPDVQKKYQEQVEKLKELPKNLYELLLQLNTTGNTNEQNPPSDQPNQNISPTPASDSSLSDTTPYKAKKNVGTSTNGNPIEVYEFWNGEESAQKRVVFIGGIHGGYEWNSILLAYEAIDYFNENQSSIPRGIKVQIIPAANPDGQLRTIGKLGRFEPPWSSVSQQAAHIERTRAGRFNGNVNAPKPANAPYAGVDLNRNWDCRHESVAYWGTVPVNAGAAPFSEKETQVLKQFLENDKPLAVVYWHSQWGAVFPGGCERSHAETIKLRDVYAGATGYAAKQWAMDSGITGDATDWLTKIDVPAIVAELKNHTDTDWTENLAGIKATLKFAGDKIPPPATQPNQPNQPNQPLGQLIMYRQGDYSDTLPNGCTIAYAGCGPTTVSNIVANLSDRNVNPRSVVDNYRTQGAFIGCSGSTMAGAKKVLENSYNFKTEVIIPEGSAQMRLDQAVPKLLPFVRAGAWIFTGANFSQGGHYFTITDIKMDNNSIELIGLETAYGNRNNIPFSYKYMAPYPYIKKAMAVRPN